MHLCRAATNARHELNELNDAAAQVVKRVKLNTSICKATAVTAAAKEGTHHEDAASMTFI
jgi:hypothetical protein